VRSSVVSARPVRLELSFRHGPFRTCSTMDSPPVYLFSPCKSRACAVEAKLLSSSSHIVVHHAALRQRFAQRTDQPAPGYLAPRYVFVLFAPPITTPYHPRTRPYSALSSSRSRPPPRVAARNSVRSPTRPRLFCPIPHRPAAASTGFCEYALPSHGTAVCRSPPSLIFPNLGWLSFGPASLPCLVVHDARRHEV